MTRRDLAASVLGGFGAVALGCVEPLPDDPTLGTVSEALSGADVRWVDTTLATTGPFAPSLKALNGPSLGATVVIAKGAHVPGDGGGGLFYWTVGTPPPHDDGITIVPSPNASPAGYWRRIFDGPVSVRWFGATGVSTDDAPSIQKAIDHVETHGGGQVYFPPGVYRTSSPLRVKASNVELRGAGNASQIRAEHEDDTVVIAAAQPWIFLYGNRITDLYFDESQKPIDHTSNGRTLAATFVANFVAERLYASGGIDGLRFETFNNVTLNHVRLVGYRGIPGGAYVRFIGRGPAGGVVRRSDVARLQECVFGGGSVTVGMKGLDIDGFVHTVNLVGVHFVAIRGTALHARNTVNSPEPPAFVTAKDMEYDFPWEECIRVDTGVNFTFVGSQLHGSVAKHNIMINNDTPTNPCRGMDFTGGFSSGANLAGIAIWGKDVTVAAMRFRANGQGGAYPGILIGGTSRGVVVTGCRSGQQVDPNNPSAPDSQHHGCQVDTGADHFCINGNVFSDNVHAGANRDGVNNGAGTGATKRVINNVSNPSPWPT